MRKLLNFFKKDKLWDFPGGIHPPEMKSRTSTLALRELPLPSQLIIPLKQHIGHEGELCVRPGMHVLRGEPLTFGFGRMLPVHAPTSGKITAIAPHPSAHPSALAERCVFLQPDGDDRWREKTPRHNWQAHSRQALTERIHQAGIAGLGGAGFPTAGKLQSGRHGIHTLIINAAECEPYITADDRLMQEYADEIIIGCQILAWILRSQRVLIGIEDNKPAAIAALRQALNGRHDLQLRVIPTKYPSGGARQLTKILTGKEVPHGGRSADIGVLMYNVGTAFAVKRAVIDDEPLTERVVTLTGNAITQPGNVWARLGTPVSHLLAHAGFQPHDGQMVIMGGPLMGFTLPDICIPVVKITNCILAPAAGETAPVQTEQPCIRCRSCADVCPAGLLPQQLFWFCQGDDHEKARHYHLDDCIECGACAYVCPSHIPLVHYFRQEKARLQAIDQEEKRTTEAKARFNARNERLEREKRLREERHRRAKQPLSSEAQQQIAAAMARIKAKNAAAGEPIPVTPNSRPQNDAVIAQREANKMHRRIQQTQQPSSANSNSDPLNVTEADPRKAAVAAAIARAKARKAVTPDNNSNTGADPRKAAVAAAIARAKAKKAVTPDNNSNTGDDPRKAAVAAAIARAKARKAALLSEPVVRQQTTQPPSKTSEE